MKSITFFESVMLNWTLFFMKILHLAQNIYFESIYNQILECAKKFRACPRDEKDNNLSPQTHVNLIPVSKDAKFCGESDFNGLNSAISRNLADY